MIVDGQSVMRAAGAASQPGERERHCCQQTSDNNINNTSIMPPATYNPLHACTYF